MTETRPCVPLNEFEITKMYLDAVGILKYTIHENWSPMTFALIAERSENPKLAMDTRWIFEKNGRLVRIE